VISRRNFFKASGLLTATAILNNIKLPVAAGGSGREVSLLIDTEKCTGCRTCVLACKQRNGLPVEKNKFYKTGEGKPFFSDDRWVDIAFRKYKNESGNERWLYTRLSCMHCTDAACVLSCPAGAIAHNDLGLVELDQEKCIGCNYCISNCTFNVIGYDRSFNRARKCNLCSDGIRKGLIPACAESCPSGAIVFGERDELINLAVSRVEELRKSGLPRADIYGLTELGGLKTLYILGEGKENSESAYALPENPQLSIAARTWGILFKPLRAFLSVAVLFALWINKNEFGLKKND